jgi:peptidoglycan hydrolase FlgJ
LVEASKFKPLRQPLTPEQQDAKLKNVGKLYEKHFLREMVKAMRGTVSEGGFQKASQAEKIFKEQLDQEYVEKWGDKGGIGLADLIHQQLLQKYGSQLGISSPIAKPRGPLPLDEKSTFLAQPFKTQGSSKKFSMEFLKNLDAPTLGISSLRMPWQGKLMNSTRLGSDEYLLDLAHENGLKSQIVFKGQPMGDLKGQELQAGDRIGLLSPEARAFFWNVEPVSNPVSE